MTDKGSKKKKRSFSFLEKKQKVSVENLIRVCIIRQNFWRTILTVKMTQILLTSNLLQNLTIWSTYSTKSIYNVRTLIYLKKKIYGKSVSNVTMLIYFGKKYGKSISKEKEKDGGLTLTRLHHRWFLMTFSVKCTHHCSPLLHDTQALPVIQNIITLSRTQRHNLERVLPHTSSSVGTNIKYIRTQQITLLHHFSTR